jgi:hypothetical protein
MRSVLAQAMVMVAGVAAGSAPPPPIAQGTVTAFADGSGPGVVAQLSAAAPNGVLIESDLPSGAAGAEPCQAAGASAWWYDPATYPAGAAYEYGQGASAPNEPAFLAGTTYTLALPPELPFSFSGVLPAGPQDCSQSVAFVVSVQAVYRLQFTATGGSITFNTGPEQLASQGTKPITISGTISITQELTPGVWSITLNDGASATTSWSISGSAEPPAVTPKPPSPAQLSITGIKPVRLAPAPPTLRFGAELSKATTLDLLLLDARGATVGRWTIRAKQGANAVSLVLPLAARHPGRDTLRITQAPTGKQTRVSVLVETGRSSG